MNKFQLSSDYKPSGSQPNAIKELVAKIKNKQKSQMLLGITGSGKTFTMANVIAQINKPTMIMVHNKTLAAQIYSEMKSLFPNNAVEYFVSYYDYYQPEAYISKTDTYIDKDSSINEQIDLLRHSATRALIERKDVIIVSSVSCIYGIGSPETYSQMTLLFEIGKDYPRKKILDSLINLQYTRNDIGFERGAFRVSGENIDIFPAHYSVKAWRLNFFCDTLESITEFDPLTGQELERLQKIVVFGNSHFVAPEPVIRKAIVEIQKELKSRIEYFNNNNQQIEAHRIKQRTEYDIEILQSTLSCKGIENYSRFLTGRKAGQPAETLFSYLPDDALLFVDESHVMVPQIRAMYNGDRARKTSLVEHGFRLPSAYDNRPLKFEEWLAHRPQTIFVSATPSEFELEQTQGEVTELIIRPTGLLDPECIIKPATNQVDDLIGEIRTTINNGFRILVTTLTKKSAEDLTNYLEELGYNTKYLHSEIHTLDRVEIIKELKSGAIDIIVGINLIREGLDIPECSLVAILDADKEGFLRSKTSLIQTIGRAARNSQGRVILYADKITESIEHAVKLTKERREIQMEYNKKHGITPTSIVTKTLFSFDNADQTQQNLDSKKDKGKSMDPDSQEFKKYIKTLQNDMKNAAENLDFEVAARIRDKIRAYKK